MEVWDKFVRNAQEPHSRLAVIEANAYSITSVVRFGSRPPLSAKQRVRDLFRQNVPWKSLPRPYFLVSRSQLCILRWQNHLQRSPLVNHCPRPKSATDLNRAMGFYRYCVRGGKLERCDDSRQQNGLFPLRGRAKDECQWSARPGDVCSYPRWRNHLSRCPSLDDVLVCPVAIELAVLFQDTILESSFVFRPM